MKNESKMKLTIAIAILSLCCVGFVLSEDTDTVSAGTSGTWSGSVTYTIDDEGTLTISGTGEISKNSAIDKSTIKTLIIKEGITSIGTGAFQYYSGMTSIIIPDSVTSIGDKAFYGCSGLISVTIPDSVTSIGDKAFQFCYKLIEVTNLSQNITLEMGNSENGYVAYYAKNIRTPLDDESILTTDTDGFVFTRYNDNGTTYNYLLGYVGKSSDIELPNAFVMGNDTYDNYGIFSYAFNDCSGLTSIAIPDSVTSIGDYAFYNCSGLTSIAISDSVTSIGDYAFYNCSGLTSIAIPDSVTSIGDYAFRECPSLTSVTIGRGVTSIGIAVFENSGLTSIVIPDSVTSIGRHAFQYCFDLTSVTIGRGVTSIGAGAFYGCSGLTSITLKNNECFSGWYTNSNCTDGKIDNPTVLDVLINNETILYLKWTHTETEIPAVESTCTKAGSTAGVKCSVCDTVLTSPEETPLKAHELLKTDAKPATCTATGNNEYYTCSVCNKVFKDDQGASETTVEAETIAALGHKMTKTDAKPATCTATGNNEYYTCSVCKKVFKDDQGASETTVEAETIAALGHDIVTDVAVEPTCTKTGLKEGSHCSRCDDATVAQQEVPALGHDMGITQEAIPATSSSPGYTAEYGCLRDGCDYVEIESAMYELEKTDDEQIAIKVEGSLVYIDKDIVESLTTEDRNTIVIVSDNDSLDIKLDHETIEALKSSGSDIQVNGTKALVKFDSEAIKNFPDEEDFTLTIDMHPELTEEQVSVVEDDAVVFSVSVNSGHYDFGNGKLTIRIEYTPAEGEDTSRLTVYYVDDDGNVTDLNGRYVNGYMVFEVDHLSTFYVGLRDVAESNTSASVFTSASMFIIMCAVVLIVSALVYIRRNSAAN